jgi:hypothetical protein
LPEAADRALVSVATAYRCLDAPAAKDALLDAGQWLLAGALAELTDSVAPTPRTARGETAQPGPVSITARVDR